MEASGSRLTSFFCRHRGGKSPRGEVTTRREQLAVWHWQAAGAPLPFHDGDAPLTKPNSPRLLLLPLGARPTNPAGDPSVRTSRRGGRLPGGWLPPPSCRTATLLGSCPRPRLRLRLLSADANGARVAVAVGAVRCRGRVVLHSIGRPNSQSADQLQFATTHNTVGAGRLRER
jgi:hypothetical protein